MAAQKARRARREEADRLRDARRVREYKLRTGRLPSTVAADVRRRLWITSSSERVDRAEVFERDQWRCGICGGDVNPEVRHPHPLSASIDHIEPLSLGGDHVTSNVRLAHLRCNVTRGNRADEHAVVG